MDRKVEFSLTEVLKAVEFSCDSDFVIIGSHNFISSILYAQIKI